jgi:hypothetical protein
MHPMAGESRMLMLSVRDLLPVGDQSVPAHRCGVMKYLSERHSNRKEYVQQAYRYQTPAVYLSATKHGP